MSELIGILGPTALRIDGVLTDHWGTPRQRAFLGALALHVGKRLSVEQVVDWVWPTDGPLPRRPAGTIDNLATKVRKWLPAEAVLSGRGGRYRLDVDPDLVDYHRFRGVIAACRRRRDIDALVSAVSLWRGRFLEDLTSEPARAKRLHVVTNEYIPAHADLADALIAADHCDEALLVLDDVQSDHPLHLRLCCLRITTLRALGRADDATAYYIATRRGLRDHGDDTGAEHLRAHYEERRGERRPAISARVPHRLPPDIVDFAGRDAALAAMDAAARDRSGALIRGVLVVHGMPGVGKTALAIRWGHRARDRFSGGELFVSLNGYSAEPTARHDTVVDELLVTLGQHLDERLSHRAREAMLRELLSERHTLVILDNALNTAQIEALMPLLSDCLVVVTSRSRLTRLVMAGAREVGVAPLSAPESKALIRSRLGVRSPTEDRLADLCGGLPLLLNLAIQVSARVVEWPPATSSPPAARAELFDWADDGDGLAPPRVVFDWSYLAQGDRERRVFRRLALLPCGSFSADVAVACAGAPERDVLPALTVLVGAHLLDQSGDRYAFHDLVREYATGRMTEDEPEETEAVHRRIVHHYRRWGSHADHALYPGNSHFDEADDEGGFPDADTARAWFHRERRNVRGVLDLAVREGLHHDAWRLAHSVSMYLGRHGFHVDARAVREVAVLAARADGDAEAEASSQSDLGLSHLTFGDLDAAYQCFSAAKRFGDETGDALARSISRLQLAKIESRRGDHSGAVALLRAGLEAVRGDEHPVARTWVLCALGDALRATSRLDEASQHLYEALFIAERLGDRSAVANCRLNLGAVHRDQGKYAAAVALCEDALAVAEGEFDTQLTAKIHIELATIHLARKARDTAERHARRAVAIATDFNDAYPRAVALSVLGTVLHAQGETSAAAAEWIAARDRYREMKDFRQADLIQARLDELPRQAIPRPGVGEVRSLHPDSQ